MQSEGGAIAAVHGALQTGSLSTSFTSSQGLLLMIPTLYKLAGQLTPFVLHVAARTVATRAFYFWRPFRCDGGPPDRLRDVMRRQRSGSAGFCADRTQGYAEKPRSVYSFFDGFRTSHEINKIIPLTNETILNLMPQAEIDAHRARALNRNIR